MVNLNLWIVLFAFVVFASCEKDDAIVKLTKDKTEQQQVFQEFWDIYDLYYPLMHRKGINWQEIHDKYYPKIDKSTSNAQLFAYLREIMEKTLQDGHSDVEFDGKFTGYAPPLNQNIHNMIKKNTPSAVHLVQSSADNPYISYGTLVADPEIGYICSKEFEPLKDNVREFNVFKKIADKALGELKNKKGIVVDVRTNPGGQGSFALYLAGRFFADSKTISPFPKRRVKTSRGSTEASLGEWITKEYEGIDDKRAAEGGTVGAVFPEEDKANSTGAFQYKRKVVVLTSRQTSSAAEYFTLAMKTQAHIYTIGNTTQGIFSGSENFTLKAGNGKWKTRLSVNDTEFPFKGTYQSFEGIGVSPDQELLPTEAQVASGADIHIEAAVKHINE